MRKRKLYHSKKRKHIHHLKKKTMSRRKHGTSHRRVHHRRRRVSGIKGINFMEVLFMMLGAVISRLISNFMAKSTNTTMQKIAPYSGVIAGIGLPMFLKSPMIKSIGNGMVAGGAVTALGSTGLKVISGMENTVIGYPYNAIPYRSPKQINGLNRGGNVNGIVDGRYVSKANFSGSGVKQASVISGVPKPTLSPEVMAGCGIMN